MNAHLGNGLRAGALFSGIGGFCMGFHRAGTHVRTHFFAKEHRQVERDNAGSRLWWMAHLCRRVKGLELRDSLNVLLYRADVRASIIERPTVSQNSNLFSAVIEKLRQSFEGKKSSSRETHLGG